jgi:hypothetical protein
MLPVQFIIISTLIISSITGSLKKGVGLSSEFGITQLKTLNVSWYYNWSSNTTIVSDLMFVPMIFSKNSVSNILPSMYTSILGFNEPDNSNQADMTELRLRLSIYGLR